MSFPAEVDVHIWSDIACPWCAVGKRRLEQAAQNQGVELRLTWHSFELDPRASSAKAEEPTKDYVQRLADKYSVPRAQAQSMVDQMTARGADLGLEFRFDRAIPANTFDAHRLLHWAKTQDGDAQTRLKVAFFDAHFRDGLDLNEHGALLSIVDGTGLDVDAASSVLSSDQWAEEVRQDEAAAGQLGVSGVPFFVLGGYGIGGAQEVVTFERMLEKVVGEAAASGAAAGEPGGAPAEAQPRPEAEEGAACGVDGC